MRNGPPNWNALSWCPRLIGSDKTNQACSALRGKRLQWSWRGCAAPARGLWVASNEDTWGTDWKLTSVQLCKKGDAKWDGLPPVLALNPFHLQHPECKGILLDFRSKPCITSFSGALSTGQTWTCWSRSRGGYNSGLKAGAPLLWGKAERVEAVQPEEKVPGRPQSSLPGPEVSL